MLQLIVSDRGFVLGAYEAIILLDKVFCTYCDRYFACYLVCGESVQSLRILTRKCINQCELCVLKRLGGLQYLSERRSK